MNDKLTVYLVTQERRGSPESVATYFASITYKKKALPDNEQEVDNFNFRTEDLSTDMQVSRQRRFWARDLAVPLLKLL